MFYVSFGGLVTSIRGEGDCLFCYQIIKMLLYLFEGFVLPFRCAILVGHSHGIPHNYFGSAIRRL